MRRSIMVVSLRHDAGLFGLKYGASLRKLHQCLRKFLTFLRDRTVRVPDDIMLSLALRQRPRQRILGLHTLVAVAQLDWRRRRRTNRARAARDRPARLRAARTCRTPRSLPIGFRQLRLANPLLGACPFAMPGERAGRSGAAPLP